MEVTHEPALITLEMSIAEAELLEEVVARDGSLSKLEQDIHNAIHAAQGKPMSPEAD
jgi:hypothetical protein